MTHHQPIPPDEEQPDEEQDDPYPEADEEIYLSKEDVEALYRHIAREERQDEEAWLAKQPRHIQRLYGDTTADVAADAVMQYPPEEWGSSAEDPPDKDTER